MIYTIFTTGFLTAYFIREIFRPLVSNSFYVDFTYLSRDHLSVVLSKGIAKLLPQIDRIMIQIPLKYFYQFKAHIGHTKGT